MFESGDSILTVFGGEGAFANFDNQVKSSKDSARDDGWQISYDPPIAADSASYSGINGDKIRYTRLIEICRGTQYAAFNLEYPKALLESYNSVVSGMVASMRSTGAGTLCPSPQPLTGVVRSPSNSANLLDAINGNVIATLDNGATLQILSVQNKWYDVIDTTYGLRGFTDRTNIKADQFVDVGFDRQFIQIGSTSSRDGAETYARLRDPELSVYLAANGQFAIAWPETFAIDEAEARLTGLKESKAIPDGALRTYGNSYIMKVCC